MVIVLVANTPTTMPVTAPKSLNVAPPSMEIRRSTLAGPVPERSQLKTNEFGVKPYPAFGDTVNSI